MTAKVCDAVSLNIYLTWHGQPARAAALQTRHVFSASRPGRSHPADVESGILQNAALRISY